MNNEKARQITEEAASFPLFGNFGAFFCILPVTQFHLFGKAILIGWSLAFLLQIVAVIGHVFSFIRLRHNVAFSKFFRVAAAVGAGLYLLTAAVLWHYRLWQSFYDVYPLCVIASVVVLVVDFLVSSAIVLLLPFVWTGKGFDFSRLH